MEATSDVGRAEEKPVLDELRALVGEANVRVGTEAASQFLRPGQVAPGLVAVFPQNTEEVQAIVDLASKNRISIVTCNDRTLLPEDLERDGLLLGFSRLDQIERIDTLNLVAHVERGVTWDQLNEALKERGVKAVAPVAANSSSVVECVTARVVGKAVSKFPDYALMNQKVVLADGSIQKTGAHTLSEECADGRHHDGGPALSTWHIGADDIFGVVTRASVTLWPICESRTCQVYGFDDYDALLTALREVPRNELGIEYLALNRTYMEWLLRKQDKGLPSWCLVVGFEGRARHVAYQEKKVRTLFAAYDCRQADDLIERMTEKLDQPWMEASATHTAFFSPFSHMRDHDAACDQAATKAGVKGEDVGKVIVSFDLGRAAYAVYDWFSEEDHTQALEDLNLSLADRGAFFDRPHGALARKIFTAIPNHLPVLKCIKAFADPDNILNPGRTIHEGDETWQPAEVIEGQSGLTVENLKLVKEKLGEALGSGWVSDNPVDLSSYGRDFTVFSGERPNIVTMPTSTEEVQAIIRIAYAHGIPVVPMSTGFNHGGLTIARKGGILVDLRRMDQTCSFDEESMTVSISPAVRMRSIWWEAVKHRATDGFHLKPILPLTFGSVSMLSNYVARGGAGTAFKYGGNPELTVGMTWVLPNGDVLKVGPSALPKVGNLPLHYCPGPEINGMFFNADGLFGICTEITAKCYPEPDDVEGLEDMMSAANYDPDGHRAFCRTVDAIYELSRENVTDFMYKSHPGVFAMAVTALLENLKVEDAISASPLHPLGIMISGHDQEELEIKREIVTEILQKHELAIMDPNMLGPEVADRQTTDPVKKALGVKENIVGSYKGAFQWTACLIKLEKIPAIAEEYEQLVKKYWKTSDPKVSVEHAMTGTDIQGPLQYGRVGSCEFDWWWDQGNPEEVKRASTMIHKTNKLMLKHGAPLFRNMFGSGEYYIPMLGTYYTVLKKAKKAFDPANLMHPDVLPITEDYV
jgi:FAD/FMN-containing dehydrogenase